MSIDILERSFDPGKKFEVWAGSFEENTVILNKYIQEKYKSKVYFHQFSEIKIITGSPNNVISNEQKAVIYKYNKPIFSFFFDKNNSLITRVHDIKEYKKYYTGYTKTKKRFIYFNVLAYNYHGDGNHHAIMVIYDRITRELEIFQRYNDDIQSLEGSYKLLPVLCKALFGEKIKIIKNKGLCISAANISNFCYVYGDFEYLYQKIEGDCLIWSLWYLELRLKNSDTPRRELFDRVIKTFIKPGKKGGKDFNLACKVLLSYKVFVENFTKKFRIVNSKNGKMTIVSKKTTSKKKI